MKRSGTGLEWAGRRKGVEVGAARFRYFDVLMAAFVVVLLLSNVIGAVRRGVVGWLKRREGADVYDTATDFTPFSARLGRIAGL